MKSSNEKEIKIFDIEYVGEYLFVYSDKFNIFFFFLDHDEKKLYKITTDKLFIIEYIDEITIPENFSEFKLIKFFKPFCANNNEYTFIGIVCFEDKSYKFKINDTNNVIYTEEIVYNAPDGIINNLRSIKNIDIESYIQKKNKIYLVGYDKKYEDFIFAVVNIEDDKIEKVYSFYSDYGDVIPISINTDTEEGKIYIVGKINILDESDNLKEVKPFVETFLLL